MGPKYRPRIEGGKDIQEILYNIHETVEDRISWWSEYLYKMSTNDKNRCFFEDPLSHVPVEDRISQCISNYSLALRESSMNSLAGLTCETPAYHPDPLGVDDIVMKDIKILQKHFLFTTVDKLATSFAVICNVKAAQDLINDLLGNNTYRMVPIELDSLVEQVHLLVKEGTSFAF
jgi:hypothetical protein